MRLPPKSSRDNIEEAETLLSLGAGPYEVRNESTKRVWFGVFSLRGVFPRRGREKGKGKGLLGRTDMTQTGSFLSMAAQGIWDGLW